MTLYNGKERRNFNVEVDEDEFKSLDIDNQLWVLLKTFATQVQTCSGRFEVIEKKQSWFRTIAVVGMAYLAGLGVVKSGTVLKWISGLF